jgi:hypothetical protein
MQVFFFRELAGETHARIEISGLLAETNGFVKWYQGELSAGEEIQIEFAELREAAPILERSPLDEPVSESQTKLRQYELLKNELDALGEKI